MEGRRRLTEDQDALQARMRNATEPPYSHAHVTETAIHREILRIYHYARPETKGVYDLGRDTERVEEENWIIRWMLWHVFRYRDNRNRNRRVPSNNCNSNNNNSNSNNNNNNININDDDSDTEDLSPTISSRTTSCE